MIRLFRALGLLAALAVVSGGLLWAGIRFDREPPYEVKRGDETVTLTPRWRFSPELRALRTLENAQDVEIVSLEPWTQWAPSSGPAGADAQCAGECIDGNRVLGRLPVAPQDRAAIVEAMGGWLRDEPSSLSMCMPEFRHAVAWTSGAKRYEVLLCYSCGVYGILVDGKPPAFVYPHGHAGRTDGDDLMNARFRAADIRHYENSTGSWVSGLANVAPPASAPAAFDPVE